MTSITDRTTYENSSDRSRLKAGIAALLAGTLAIAGALAAGVPAYAAPVNEMTGAWIDPPAQLSSGEPLVGDWRVNLNDDAEPPSNDPVDNVVASFTVSNGRFTEVPDICQTAGVAPVSEISADGSTLTCNVGTLQMGAALAVQTSVMADGPTGSSLTLGGSIGGQNVDLDPVPIVNPFLMDVDISNPTAGTYFNATGTQAIVDIPWTLYTGLNSDPGPANVTIPLQFTASNGNPVLIGSDQRDGLGNGCTPRYTGNAGHPVSEGSPLSAEMIAPFVGGCTLQVVDATAGRYNLVLTGIDYSRANPPTRDSGGRLLPADRTAVATGTIWLRAVTDDQNGSIVGEILGPPTYTAPTGQSSTDDTTNNQVTRAWIVSGAWNGRWTPGYTGGPGESFADNYRVAAGTTVQQSLQNSMGSGDLATFPDTAQYGNCLAFDTRWVTYESAVVGTFTQNPSAAPQVQYYVGGNAFVDPANASYDPNRFDCGIASGWTTQEPADKSTVRAVRIVYPLSTVRQADANPTGVQPINLSARTMIHSDAPQGQDVWMFGNAMRNGNWTDSADRDTFPCVTQTPGARYPCTKNGLDVLRIVSVTPAITKVVDDITIVPGIPVGYTLTYSANGAGNVPPEVDGFEIVDTLPAGMTYVPGSATPAPVVSVAAGQQVLTWTLDAVTSNVLHELSYQAVADSSVTPGSHLTNTAVADYQGVAKQDSATVTTSINGYTTILKTSDVEYISNRAGDGVGTGSWTVAIESSDPYSQSFTDTIDILPYNGDERGTSFSGSYALGTVGLPDGGTVYYTDADPSTLTYDPDDPSNGAAGDPTGNTVGWSTTRPANPTAVRVIGGELAPGGTYSFQVPITTSGAAPQDVYVNSAQARAQHTELVMRTSAALVVTDYVVEKTSDVPEGESVAPGDEIEYTITVTQQGDVPADAVLTDDLTAVLDDADVVGQPTTSIGTITEIDGGYSWEGVLPVGGVATITYTVRVKDVADLKESGDTVLTNVVESPGCVDAASCTVEVVSGYWEYSKTSTPAPGETVRIGDVVTYHLQIVQGGDAAVKGAAIEDDLSGVLDDATWNDDVEATSGTVSYAAPTLRWSGDLAVGQMVDLTYSVVVTGGGDWALANAAVPACSDDDPACVPPPPGDHCVPAPDQNENCRTDHILGDFAVDKVADPESGSAVQVGDVVTYTVRVTHIGIADVAAEFSDDLVDVLDDATWNDDAQASAGTLEFDRDSHTLAWTGTIGEGDEVTVTYSVTVVADGDLTLENVVSWPCVPTAGQDENCEVRTDHHKGRFTFSKTSDPPPGSEVAAGDIVTYTVTVAQVGPGAVAGAGVVDDISDVLPVASWNDDAEATSGTVTRDGDEVAWTGNLAVGQVVVITYSVTVGDQQDAAFRNVVSTHDPRGTCVAATDGNPDCKTEHHTPGILAATGLLLSSATPVAAALLLGAGLVFAVWGRRRGIRQPLE